MMTRTQLRQRDRLLTRHESALAQWSDRSGSDFQRAITEVARELDRLAREADATRGDCLERARTWRHAGNAYFDLGNGQDAAQLRLAATAFQKAETLLQGIDDPIEKMKLDLSYGRALLHQFRLSKGNEAAFAQQARLRHASALAIAEAEMPNAVASLKTALAQSEQAIALLQGAENLSGKITKLEREITHLKSRPPASERPEEIDYNALLSGQLRDFYDREVAAGRVSETRKHALDPVISEIEDNLHSKPSDASGVTSQSSRMQELKTGLSRSISQDSMGEAMASMMHLAGEADEGALPAGSRADAVRQRFSRLKLYLAKEGQRRHKGGEESNSVMKLFKRCGCAGTYLQKHGQDDTAVHQEEIDVLRQLTCDIRAFSLRNHLTLAAPVWPSLPLPQNPNAVFFSGSDALRQALARICEQQRLKLLVPAAPKDFAAMRWDQLRSCHAAVFDFTGYVRPDYRAALDLGSTGSVAAVAYELGMALTLGRAVVVLAKEGQDIPFDVDIEPVRLSGNSRDAQRLADAIDDAVYGLQRGGEKSSITATRMYLQQKFSAHENPFTTGLLELIDDAVARDPVQFRRFVEPVLGSAGPGVLQMIFPAWPGRYPQVPDKRLFHVTPFGPTWAENTMKIAEQACKSATPSIQYIRGDQVLDPDIIRSIWNNLCQATHVVVDLTGLNANVALELGIVHTLGPEDKVLILTQDSATKTHFPAIAKTRMHHYSLSSTPGLNSLRDALDRFLADHD